MDMGTEQLAHDFLAYRRFAFVGVRETLMTSPATCFGSS